MYKENQHNGICMKLHRLWNAVNNISRRFIALSFFSALRITVLDIVCRALASLSMPVIPPVQQVQLRGQIVPLYVRPGTSDVSVLQQIFIDLEYKGVMNGAEPRTIIDCGANVGYFARYALATFPNAQVIAVEPDTDNLRICELNLAPYGKRAKIIQAGVWDRASSLVVCRKEFGWRAEWGVRVREARPGEPVDVKALDLGTLQRITGAAVVDLVKMDIEGSELQVFSADDLCWLQRTKNIVIELHGQQCRDAFFSSIQHFSYDVRESGELTIVTDLCPVGV